MEFKDLKRIWDEQNNENLFIINESILHRRVIQNNIKIRRKINAFEWTVILGLLGLSLFALIDGILYNKLFQLIDALIFLITAGYVFKSRLDRFKNEGKSNLSLLNNLEMAIRNIDHQIKRNKSFRKWFILPLVCVAIIQIIFIENGGMWWLWILIFGSFVYSDWSIKKELYSKILPNKEDLINLKKLLLTDENI